jgi:HK97 family phage major capsid protein
MNELQNEMKSILEDAKKTGAMTGEQEIRLGAIKAQLDSNEVQVRSAAASAAAAIVKPVARDSNTILRSISKGSDEVNDITFVDDIVRQFRLQSPLFAAHSNVQQRSNGMVYHYNKVTKGGAGYAKTEGVAGTTDSASAIAIANVSFATYSGQKIIVTQEAMDDFKADIMGELLTLGMAKCSDAWAAAAITALETSQTTPGTYTETATTSWQVSDLISAYFEVATRNRYDIRYIVNSTTAATLINLFDAEDSYKLAAIGFSKDTLLVEDGMATNELFVCNPTLALAVAMKVPVRVFKDEVSEGYSIEVQPRLAVALRDSTAVANRVKKAS